MRARFLRRVPSTVRELRALVATGGIDDSVLVWAPQLRDWTTLKAAAPLLGQLGRGQEEDDAARLLQSRWRGHSARRHARQEDGAARLMQARCPLAPWLCVTVRCWERGGTG